MAAIPDLGCPTLEASDRALEARQDTSRRQYLGMSAIGNECERQLWYGFRWTQRPRFDANTLKRFEDGHRSEDIMIARLAATDGLEVHSVGPDGKQFGFKDLGGHFSGHMDGVILGLIQAPKTWHVLEGKASEKWEGLDKAKRKVGEKHALQEWNATYYAQAVLYMHYAELDRHYLVCTSPGARRWTAVRTNSDPAFAGVLRAKAERIIFSDHAPARIGTESSFACKWCDFADLCHRAKPAERNCRTCLHSTAMREGGWQCANPDFPHDLSAAEQEAGCPAHRYLPDLVPGEQIDAGPHGVTYRMTDGTEWTDHGQNI